jgi:hypothetical protein|nr:MAG TPA: NudE protein [Caudoviricetes sp.]
MDKYTKYALNRLDELELKYNQTIESLTNRVETLEKELDNFKEYQVVRNRAITIDINDFKNSIRVY